MKAWTAHQKDLEKDAALAESYPEDVGFIGTNGEGFHLFRMTFGCKGCGVQGESVLGIDPALLELNGDAVGYVRSERAAQWTTLGDGPLCPACEPSVRRKEGT